MRAESSAETNPPFASGRSESLPASQSAPGRRWPRWASLLRGLRLFTATILIATMIFLAYRSQTKPLPETAGDDPTDELVSDTIDSSAPAVGDAAFPSYDVPSRPAVHVTTDDRGSPTTALLSPTRRASEQKTASASTTNTVSSSTKATTNGVTSTTAQPRPCTVTVIGSVAMHHGSSEQSSVVAGDVPAGSYEVLDISQARGTWFKISSRDTTGWIAYLGAENTPTSCL